MEQEAKERDTKETDGLDDVLASILKKLSTMEDEISHIKSIQTIEAGTSSSPVRDDRRTSFMIKAPSVVVPTDGVVAPAQVIQVFLRQLYVVF